MSLSWETRISHNELTPLETPPPRETHEERCCRGGWRTGNSDLFMNFKWVLMHRLLITEHLLQIWDPLAPQLFSRAVILLRISYECPVCLSVRAAAIRGSMARGCVSSTLPQLLADSYLLHMSFSNALKLDNWLLQGEWSETERGQERSHRVLDMISSDKPFRRSCRPTLVHCERGLHQSRRQGSLRAILKDDYHSFD